MLHWISFWVCLANADWFGNHSLQLQQRKKPAPGDSSIPIRVSSKGLYRTLSSGTHWTFSFALLLIGYQRSTAGGVYKGRQDWARFALMPNFDPRFAL